jgi:hypothetical protein
LTRLTKPLHLFVLLQLLDIATTLVAIAMGGGEKNPIVSYFMNAGPVAGLLISKTVVIALACSGAFLQKYNGIKCANAVFSVVIAWNVTVIFRLGLMAVST